MQPNPPRPPHPSYSLPQPRVSAPPNPANPSQLSAPPNPGNSSMLNSIYTRLLGIATLISLVSTASFLLYAFASHQSTYYTIGLYGLYLSIACQIVAGFNLIAQWIRSEEPGKKPRQLALLILGILPFGFILAIIIILVQYVIQRRRALEQAQRQGLNQNLRSDLKDQAANIFTDQVNNAAQTQKPTIKSTVRDLAGPAAERNLSSQSNGLVGVVMSILLVATLIGVIVAFPRGGKGAAAALGGGSLPFGGSSSTSHPKSHQPSGTVKIFPLAKDLIPAAIVGGPDGNVWFAADSVGGDLIHKVGYITPTGTMHEFSIPVKDGFPTGSMAVGPDKALWFTLANNGSGQSTSIGRITTSGSYQSFQTPEGLGSFGNIHIVCGLIAGPDSNVWFSEQYTNKIGQITPSGTVTEFADTSTHGFPTAITAGPDGNLWFSDKDGIGKITPSGSVTSFPLQGGAACLTGGPGNKVWFTDSNGNVDSIASDGTITTVANGVGGGCITTGLDGNLWFGGNGIDRMTPSGAVKSYPINGTTDSLDCLTAGPDGNIWFTTQSQDGFSGSIGYVVP